MSYDVRLRHPYPESALEDAPRTEALNYTYNVAPMLTVLFQPFTNASIELEDPNPAYGIWCIKNFSGHCAAFLVQGAIHRGRKLKDELVKLNPHNGWGSYDGCMKWLSEIQQLCERYPNWIVEID